MKDNFRYLIHARFMTVRYFFRMTNNNFYSGLKSKKISTRKMNELMKDLFI